MSPEQEQILQLESLLDHALLFKSDLLPAEWYEGKISMPFNAAIPGRVSYNNGPYWREIVNRFSPLDPAIDITIMGPAQMGKTFMVLNPIVMYTIAQNPCNIMLLTGHSELTGDTVVELDKIIDELGIRHLIKPAIQKARNNRTGDTATKKEFGSFTFRAGSVTNHNLLRFYNVMVMLVDDLDAAKQHEKSTGNTIELVKGRTKAYGDRAKRGWISTPQVKGSSLIESQLELSDKRDFNVPCPKCKEPIVLDWKVKIDEKEMAGLVWKLDNSGRVDPKSVHYVCPLCAAGFTERHKRWFLNEGIWKPTQVAKEPDHYGYKINGLYAFPGMTSWTTLISRYINCHPEGQPRIEDKYQTFINIDIGDVYDPPKDEIRASDIMKNALDYQLGVIPASMSKRDGNGEIIQCTFSCDVNGNKEDGRLDWSIIAWAESGATYLVNKGSIGSFVPYESPKAKQKRQSEKEVLTYELNRPNSIWKQVDAILGTPIPTDMGKKMNIFMAAIDVGYLDDLVYNYIDNSNFIIIGVKGEKESALLKVGVDVPVFKVGRSRPNLFLVQVNMVKNDLSGIMRLKWKKEDKIQPFGFMNFPQGLDFNTFYSHFESEHKVEEYKNGSIVGFKWEKKTPTSQNHFFDVTVYQYAMRDILMWQLFKRELKMDKYSWVDYVNLVLGQR